jgi:hypothetical protein
MRATDWTSAEWRKSSFSSANSNCVEVLWRKSSRSSATSNCVEVGFGPDMVAARDSKNPLGAVLVFAPARWSAFLGTLTRS